MKQHLNDMETIMTIIGGGGCPVLMIKLNIRI